MTAATAPATLPVVKDVCGNTLTAPTPVVTDDPASLTCNGTRTYTYTYKDCANKEFVWTYTYTISVPDLSPEADGGREVPCVEDANGHVVPTLTDACSRSYAGVQNGEPVVNVTNGAGTVTYNYTYTDCKGKTYPWKYVYTVVPNAFTAPADGTENVTCKSAISEPTKPIITVCGTTINLVADSPIDEVVDGCGDYTYKYDYKVNGVAYTWKYVYKVSPNDFPMPDNKTVTVACTSAVAAPELPEVKDACGRILTPVSSSAGEMPLCEGSVAYTYTYEDCAGHTHDWVYTYNIVKNAPVIASDGYETSKNISCIADATEPTSAMIPSAKNSCGEDVTPTMVRTTDWSGGKENCTGKIIYTYTYTDCGKSSVWTYTYNLNDNVKPTFNAISPLTVNCSAADRDATISAWLSGVTATDNCGTPTVTNNYASLSLPASGCGTVEVTFTATDACGNISTTTADIVVEDNTAPVIGAVSDLTLICDDTDNDTKITSWLNSVTATDNCGQVTLTNDYNSSSLPTNGCGTVTVTFTAVDECNNTSTTTADIVMKDETAPVIATNLVSEHKGCDPTIVEPTTSDFTLTESCDPNAAITLETGAVVSNGCERSQSW
ncbi:hypothetical protein, partial [Ruminobacter amylophilus]|uniref:HYR-like domain-containing protein n=1 Tax=Ruminobacter amylophilus TaxID=867 RepID=UPI0038641A14